MYVVYDEHSKAPIERILRPCPRAVCSNALGLSFAAENLADFCDSSRVKGNFHAVACDLRNYVALASQVPQCFFDFPSLMLRKALRNIIGRRVFCTYKIVSVHLPQQGYFQRGELHSSSPNIFAALVCRAAYLRSIDKEVNQHGQR